MKRWLSSKLPFNTMKQKLPVILILLLAFFLRFINIDSNPPALYGDEQTLVYDAYSILKTGRDQTGDFLPLTFAMSEGRPPVYVYLSIPFVAVFGPNALSARLLSVFSGVGIVLLIYLLLQTLISRRVAVVAAFFVAISPWDLTLSRGGFETHFALFLSLLGITAFVKAQSRPWLLMISALSFGLAIHTYHSYKVVLPLLLPVLVWFVSPKNFIGDKLKKQFVVASAVFVLFVGLWLYQLVSGSEVRFKNTNVFNQPNLTASITQKINEERTLDTTPLASLIHNKPVEYLSLLGDNYFSHFSFDFLFLHGDGNPRHNQGLMGMMYVVDSLLILLGIIWLFNERRRLLLLLGAWVAVAPLATILVSSAHGLRSTFMLPPLIIFSATGFVYLFELSKKQLLTKILLVVIVLGLMVQFIVLFDRVYSLYPKQYGKFWSVGAKVVAEEALINKQKYDFIVISDRIDGINTAFPPYGEVDPNEVIEQNDKRPFLLGEYSFKKYDNNIYIGMVPDKEVNGFIDRLPGKVLYLGAAEEIKTAQNYDTIYGSDGLPLLIKISKFD